MYYLAKQKWISVYLTMTFLFMPFLSLLTFAATPAQAGVVLGEEVNLTPNGFQRADHSDPEIYESKVVWVDDRNNNMDIYMKDLATGLETAVTSNSTYQYQPTIFGNRIAWVDHRNGNQDIFVKDLTTGAETAAVSNSSDQSNPKLNGDMLIYEERPANAWWYWAPTEIYTKNLVTGIITKLATGSNADAPDIWGNLAAWRKDGTVAGIWLTELVTGFNGQISNSSRVSNASLNFSAPSIYQNLVTWSQDGPDSGIYLKDIGSGISNISNGSYQYGPDIFGSNVVWEKHDNNWGNSRIYRKNLSSGVISELTSNGTLQYSPAIYGNKVVWQDERNGTPDIFVKDLTTGGEAQVNSDETFKRADQVSGDIDGAKVVWVDNRMDAPGLYSKDLTTGVESRFKGFASPKEATGQWNPRISGDNVVWADTVNDPFGIYATNIQTMAQTTISAGTNQFAPAISGNLVAWEKGGYISNGTTQDWISQIFTGVIGGPLPGPVSNGTRQYSPDVSGSQVVWQEYLSGGRIWLKDLIDNSSLQVSNNDEWWAWDDSPSIDGDRVVWAKSGSIYLKDLATGQTKKLSVGSNSWDPSISGNIVVWTNWVNNSAGIVVMDLSSGAKTRINTTGGWGSDPRVSGNRVIWTDYRNGDADIYSRTFALNAAPPLEQWIPANSGLPGNDRINLAVSPNYATDQTIFSGTYNNGGYKSIDGGANWTGLSNGTSQITSLAISPNYANDQTIFASTWSGVVNKSTDGGANWTGLQGSNLGSLAISPNYANDQTIFASTWSGVVNKSTDGGTNWILTGSVITSGGLSSLAISPNFATDQTIFAGTYWDGMFKSTDGGTNWSPVITGLDYWLSAFAISPNYATDQTIFAGTYTGWVFKSIDGGENWSPEGTELGYGINSLAISPNYITDQTIFAGANDGVFKSVDGGGEWSELDDIERIWGVNDLAIASYGGYQDLFASSYWSGDFVYKYTYGGQQDFTAPIVTGTNPSNNQTNIPLDTSITINFSEPLNPATVNDAGVYLQAAGSSAHIPATLSYDSSGSAVGLMPSAPLNQGTSYNVTVTTGVTDVAGNPLATNYNFTFKTISLLNTYEETLGMYEGAWLDFSVPGGASGDNLKLSYMNSTTATFDFNGNDLEVVAVKAAGLGSFKVIIDGINKGVVSMDNGDPNPSFKQVIAAYSSLGAGAHKLELISTGLVVLDAIRAQGQSGSPIHISESAATYVGGANWFELTSPLLTEGHTKVNMGNFGNSATFTFTGSKVRVVGLKGPQMGKAQIWLDGTLKGTYDFYAADYLIQSTLATYSGLTPGAHTLKITVIQSKNFSSAGFSIWLDGLDVWQ